MTPASLNWLFLDLNSYFASVEQELRPELRGRPIAIVPVHAETTCCIAVSYQARAYGIRTGLSVASAKQRCPHLQLVEARPKVYVEMHHRILAAVETCLPVEAVLSCDEFACRLLGTERQLPRALALAAEVKGAIRRGAGASLRCSVGLAPNRLLAKIAADMQKPDGLTAIEAKDLPQALYRLELAAIPGVGTRMEDRLRAAGVPTVQALCGLSRERMAQLWGGVLGERLWLELRAEDLPAAPVHARQTVSRQHILPPASRTPAGCRQTALKMLQDCVRRMRRQGLEAEGLGVVIYYLHHDHAFHAEHRIPACADPISLQEQFLPLIAGAPDQVAHSVCVYLSRLQTQGTATLFPSPAMERRRAVTSAMEAVHRRFGKEALYLGSVHGVQRAAPARISFGPPPPLEEF